MKIGYARVTTSDQNRDLQTDALKEAGCEQVYEESASGKSRERPELENCLRALRAGDTLIVWRMDRLARSLKDLIDIVNDLEKREIGFLSLTEAIDTTSATGKLTFHIFGAMAEFERNLTRERTMAGLEAARARGRVGGRRFSMSSSDIKKAKAMLLDPDMTKSEVAKHFNVSRPTLNSALNK